jgi:glucose-6-phosphate 1-epimerase
VASCNYTDKTTDPISTATQKEPLVKITGITDRVYKNVSGSVKVSESGNVIYSIERDNLHDVVIWNPWVDAAKGMSDFGPDDGYKNMRKFA